MGLKKTKKHSWSNFRGARHCTDRLSTEDQNSYSKPNFAHFWKSSFEKEMGDQINGTNLLHSSDIYIQNMKITTSLCKKLLMIKSVIFLHLV